ncbi:unnamed protein product, partial [Prorocentrum cordatum]
MALAIHGVKAVDCAARVAERELDVVEIMSGSENMTFMAGVMGLHATGFDVGKRSTEDILQVKGWHIAVWYVLSLKENGLLWISLDTWRTDDHSDSEPWVKPTPEQ